MKHSILYLPIILILFASCSKREIAIVAEDVTEEVFYLENEVKPYTGICNIIDPDDGRISQRLNFKKGILSGEAVAFHTNGKIRRTGNFKDGMLDGSWEFFDKEGNKTMIVNYNKDNLNGTYTTWFANGKIQESGIYKENSKVGEWVTYNENGQVVSKKNHSNS